MPSGKQQTEWKNEGEMVEWGNKIKDLTNKNKKLKTKMKAMKDIFKTIKEEKHRLVVLIDSKNQLIDALTTQLRDCIDEIDGFGFNFEHRVHPQIDQMNSLLNDSDTDDE